MERRFEGFLAPQGLYVLDTQTGEVKFISHGQQIAVPDVITSHPIAQSSFKVSNHSPIQNFSPFETEVITSYPYLIAFPFHDLLKEKDSRMKCKLMVDTFTAVLKYLALQLASEYIRATDVKDMQLHQTLTKDLSRPLISAWNLLISRCIPVLKDNKVAFFSPELKDAYEKLETKCKDPFLVTQSYSDENGEIKAKTKKLGKIQALINYRNGLAHGFNQSQARAQKEFDEYYPLLCDILQEIRFVSRYTLWHVESSKEGVNGIRLMGSSPSLKKVDFDRKGVNPFISPLFLLNDATGDILPLYAFFDVDQSTETGLPELGKDVFVFEGNTKNSVIYLSSSGEHLEKTTRFNHWKDLLAQKQLEVSWVNEKTLTPEIFHSIGVYISSSGIQALITSGKYLREASIPRKDLDELLDSFSYSSFNGFILGGESGIGKSTLLAQKTEQWQAEGHMVTFYRGSSLNQRDIANKFLRDAALKIHYLEEFLTAANAVFTASGKKCYLIIDALNEYSGDLNGLIKSIDSMVFQASNFPWFKLIVSIRDSAYNRTQDKLGVLAPMQYYTIEEEKGGEKVQTNVIRLQPFAKDFVEQLFNAYRDYKWKDISSSDVEGVFKFRPLTHFKDLNKDGSTLELLRSPLMARLIMQSFHRSKLPDQLKNDEAMRLYLDNIILEKSEDHQGFPERKKLLNLLVIELDRQNAERLDRDYLMNINSIRSYLINNQKDSPYIQLLDLGVLMEEWEKDVCYVRFSFDKFFEFLLAELHWPKIQDDTELFLLCKRIIYYRILQGAVEIIVTRFCLNEQSEVMVQLIDKAEDESAEIKSVIKDLCARILIDLATEHHEVFKRTIDLMPQNPGQLDLEILQLVIDRLFLTGNLISFEYALGIAVKEAEILDNQKYLSDLLLNSAQFDILQGRYQESRCKLNEVLIQKEKICDDYGRLICMRKIGIVDYREHKISASLEIWEKALSESKLKKYNELVGALLNNLGVLYKNQGRIEDAEKLYLESLDIKRALGDMRGISMSLNNLGILYKNQGKIEEAEKIYLDSLEIKRSLGDKEGISSSLNNLGSLYKDQGKIEEAEKLYLESLEIRRLLGHKKGISSSLSNLGIIETEKNEILRARKFFVESIAIKKEINDSSLLPEIHRAYPYLSSEERAIYFTWAMELDNSQFSKKEKFWAEDIQLMNLCSEISVLDIDTIRAICKKIIDLAIDYKLEDADDLPIETFIIVSKKLISQSEFDIPKELCNQALEWIGDRKTIMKKKIQEILL